MRAGDARAAEAPALSPCRRHYNEDSPRSAIGYNIPIALHCSDGVTSPSSGPIDPGLWAFAVHAMKDQGFETIQPRDSHAGAGFRRV